MFHCGPWTNYKHAVELFGDKVALDICINSQKDVYDCTPEQMREQLVEIKEVCKNANAAIRADTFMIQGNIEDNLKKIDEFTKMTREVL